MERDDDWPDSELAVFDDTEELEVRTSFLDPDKLRRGSLWLIQYVPIATFILELLAYIFRRK